MLNLETATREEIAKYTEKVIEKELWYDFFVLNGDIISLLNRLSEQLDRINSFSDPLERLESLIMLKTIKEVLEVIYF